MDRFTWSSARTFTPRLFPPDMPNCPECGKPVSKVCVYVERRYIYAIEPNGERGQVLEFPEDEYETEAESECCRVKLEGFPLED